MAPLQRSWQAIGLTEESRANDVRPYRFTFSKWVNRLLCPVGHLLYKRSWQAAGLTEESLLFSDAVPYAPITSLGTRFEMPQMIS